ncbi:hypothetical protein L1049_022516 [Liquidambar formosana]|uniref:TF-B3 domain-containing protein n=1 Tax=Liquidambar formosana TaxID=63359 RepID=A0AAP0RCJ4_LIQFO
MRSASANSELSDNEDVEEKPKINGQVGLGKVSGTKASVPSLVSVTAATVEACSMNFVQSLAAPAVPTVPVFQSQPGFVPFGTEHMPVFHGVNSPWCSQVVGSPYQFHCFPYSNMCVPGAAPPNLKRKIEVPGNSYNPLPMGTFFGHHMPGGFYQDSVFHASLMPVRAVFQNPFFSTPLRGPPLNFNFSASLNLEPIKSQEMNVVTASQDSQAVTSSGFSSSASTHKRKVVRPSCSSTLSMTVSSDGREIANMGASDKHELPPLRVNKVSNTRLADFPNSSDTLRTACSPMNTYRPEDEKEIEGKGWLLLVRKELRNTDVGNLGRIVLPKKEAEANLPPLVAKDGLVLRMEDTIFSVNWKFKYRYWPNNRSRMYVMENTGDFVKMHKLQSGDYFIVYKEESSGKYIARGKKVSRPSYAEDMEGPINQGRIQEGDIDHNGQIGPQHRTLVQSEIILESSVETDTAAEEPFDFEHDASVPSQFTLPDLDPEDIV